MIPPAPAANAATSTYTGAVLVARERIAELATAAATVPKTLTEARTILSAINAKAAQLAAKGLHAASTVPSSTVDAGKMTDKQLLEHYVELQGAERRAFFAIHGAAIWRAHESACRSRRARS